MIIVLPLLLIAVFLNQQAVHAVLAAAAGEKQYEEQQIEKPVKLPHF